MAGASPARAPKVDVRTFINVDKQRPHEPAQNLVPGKGILTENAQEILDAFHRGEVKTSQLVDEYKTRVDFGKHIAIYINGETGFTSPTTEE